LWACGYFGEPEYFVSLGRIEGVSGLKRAGSHIRHDGSFVNARFQLRSGVPRFLDGKSWAWTNNPFLGTTELRGLKILMLLVSNWDAKDARDMSTAAQPRGNMNTNLAIFEDNSTDNIRLLYANMDWGASLGKWGNTFTWTKWDCRGFAEQTRRFLTVTDSGLLRWGFSGKHEKDLTSDITLPDVQWLLQYLGRISDEQIRIGLTASGATPEETDCYASALRQRIETLQKVVMGRTAQITTPAPPEQDRMFQGKLIAVDTDAKILTAQGADYKEMTFRYSDNTEIIGAESITRDLPGKTGAELSITYNVDHGVNKATRIELLP
jgi:hypothetical protein